MGGMDGAGVAGRLSVAGEVVGLEGGGVAVGAALKEGVKGQGGAWG